MQIIDLRKYLPILYGTGGVSRRIDGVDGGATDNREYEGRSAGVWSRKRNDDPSA